MVGSTEGILLVEEDVALGEKVVPKGWVLTASTLSLVGVVVGVAVEDDVGVDVGVGVGVVEVLVDVPTVPDGAMLKATYPNRPDDALPQFSYG